MLMKFWQWLSPNKFTVEFRLLSCSLWYEKVFLFVCLFVCTWQSTGTKQPTDQKRGNCLKKGWEILIFSTLLLDWSEGSCPCALGGENSNAGGRSPHNPPNVWLGTNLNNNQANRRENKWINKQKSIKTENKRLTKRKQKKGKLQHWWEVSLQPAQCLTGHKPEKQPSKQKGKQMNKQTRQKKN